MAKQEAEQEPQEAPDHSGLDKRVGDLEQGQQSILLKLDALLGNGQPKTDAAPRDPISVADEIRQQLEERDRREAADRKAAEGQSAMEELRQKVAELTEKEPQPMPRRVEKLMGWT